MQIKTALSIGAGIIIGAMCGMNVSEDTKCKMASRIRKRLIRALGAEEKRYDRKPITKNYASYKQYYDKKTPKHENTKDRQYEELLYFDNFTEADTCREQIYEMAADFGSITVVDLANMRRKTIDYTWNAYGWPYHCLGEIAIHTCDGTCRHKMDLPDPVFLGP